MAYSKKIATCIIGSGGKIYDEDPKGAVAVPFNEEFKIRVINKNDRKIGFDVFIDSEKITKTGRIIVNAYDKIDIERYIENDNSGARFRFVPKDSNEAKMEGKDKELYTGVIEVKAYLEKERPKEIIREIHHDHYWDHHHYYDWPKRNIWYCCDGKGYSGISGFHGSTGQSFSLGSNNTSCTSNLSQGFASSKNLEEGAVVKGSNSNQSFYSTYVDLEDDYVSLKMYIMGYHQSEKIRQKVEEVMTSKDKKYCTKCGHEIHIDDNFCGKCGGKNV